jgi:hypothetical protein
MEVIKDTVKNLMQSWDVKRKRASKDDPRVLLKKIFTKKELGHVKFNYFRKGTIGINVDSSAWLYHFSLQKENLLAKLHRKHSNTIKDIRFRIGEINEKEKIKTR